MIEEILLNRIVFKIKPLSIELEKKIKIENKEFLDSLSTIKKMEEYNHDLLIIRASKIFKSKIAADREIFKWNNKKPNVKKPIKNKKEYSFKDYSKIDENGKSVKTSEKFSTFYNDIKAQYEAQRKHHMEKDLTWIKESRHIHTNDSVCYYCGVNEQILKELYNEGEICKTKRNRGAWFELDRKDSKGKNNIYSKDNMVLCCYFCNNHKSDVITSKDMRGYFGESMYNYLSDKVKHINS